jgi:hypothetical protein
MNVKCRHDDAQGRWFRKLALILLIDISLAG